jgi:DNA-binding response OmpR family regulator
MQEQLLKLFFAAPRHSLSKQEICDSLWPRKPDASDTLYTLIKRLKPVLEEQGGLQITSDRGKGYILEDM